MKLNGYYPLLCIHFQVIPVRALHQWDIDWPIDWQLKQFLMLKMVSGKRTLQRKLGHRMNLTKKHEKVVNTVSLVFISHTGASPGLLQSWQPEAHCSLLSSTCVVLLSLISDSFTIPFSPIWGGSVPFAVGFQDPLGHRSKRGKGQAATGAQAPEQGWVSSWEPLLCRLSRRTDTSMENSSENAPWWNSSHHGLWWSGCSSKPFSHNLCCFAPGWAGAVCNLGWN